MADITLLAFGTSFPQIPSPIIGLGPRTLVGSAAFDLFPINTVYLVVPKAETVKTGCMAGNSTFIVLDWLEPSNKVLKCCESLPGRLITHHVMLAHQSPLYRCKGPFLPTGGCHPCPPPLISLLLVCLFNVFYRSTCYCFLRILRNVVLAPIYKVVMVDFFMADQLWSKVAETEQNNYVDGGGVYEKKENGDMFRCVSTDKSMHGEELHEIWIGLVNQFDTASLLDSFMISFHLGIDIVD
ncbi:uncharacterized protein LOC116260526 isoform X2 [Nymphaea colorata]|uniref:uncharacterized protein LOC116260526 isoform X2 n=1 Tax=Nymphaea colorata TaxID=210225 RepID=UPI00214F1F28|nr:uncharacterized protein LOC116260526 isoform X2 [Nymphaea colorata]